MCKTGSRLVPFQKPVERGELKSADMRTRLRTEIETGEAVAEIMGPGADPRFNRHAAPRKQRERVQIALDIRVEPATHGANRNIHIAERTPDAEPVPKLVVGRMLERNTPHVELECGGGDIGIYQRQMIDVGREGEARRCERSEVLVQPGQAVSQLQRSAWRIEAVEIFVVAGNNGEYRDAGSFERQPTIGRCLDTTRPPFQPGHRTTAGEQSS